MDCPDNNVPMHHGPDGPPCMNHADGTDGTAGPVTTGAARRGDISLTEGQVAAYPQKI